MDQSDQIVIYNTDDGQAQVRLYITERNAWLTQKQMAHLFGVTPASISHHINAIIREGEIPDTPTFKQLLKVPGQERSVNHYNLEMIIAVGYRVRGPRGTQFRQWATTILREYLEKGFALDDARLKNDGAHSHFDELLDRIREIRMSEKQFFRKICDVIQTSSDDYNGSLDTTRRFFATIQNKLHFAVHGDTAAGLICSRADANKPHMGLTTWDSENGPTRTDIFTAKNYLTRSELDEMKRLTNMFLDYAEDRARKRKGLLLADWIDLTDRWLVFNERESLQGAGNRSAVQAKKHASEQWDAYQRRLDQKQNVLDAQSLEQAVKKLRPDTPDH